MNDFILTVQSKYADDEPQYTVHLTQPLENCQLLRLFHLVRSVYDSFGFCLVDGRWVFVPSEHRASVKDGCMSAYAKFHTDLGRLIELYFQDELRQIMHPDWDRFSLIWNPQEYMDW